MAYRFVHMYMRSCRTIALRCNLATGSTKCTYSSSIACEAGWPLSDNRGFSTAHTDNGTVNSDSYDIVDGESTQRNESHNEDHRRSRVSWSVRKMRKSLRDFHGLDSVSTDRSQNENVPGPQKSSAAELDADAGRFSPLTNGEPVDHRDVLEKFPFLDKKGSSKKYERVLETHFGIVRLDNKHPKIGKRKNKDLSSPDIQSQMSTSNRETNVSYFDEEYFGDLSKSETGTKFEDNSHILTVDHVDGQEHSVTMGTDCSTSDKKVVQDNPFEEQYFSRVLAGNENNGTPLEMSNDLENPNTHDVTDSTSGNGEFSLSNSDISTEHLGLVDDFIADKPVDGASGNMFPLEENIFDEQYFGNPSPCSQERLPESALDNAIYDKTVNYDHSVHLKGQETLHQNPTADPKLSRTEKPSANTAGYNVAKTEGANSLKQENTESKDIYVETITKQEKRQKSVKKANVEDPKTAYDMAMKIRFEAKEKHGSGSDNASPDQEQTVPREARWTGQKDTHGYRILSNQVLDIQNMPISVVVNILKDSILYEDDSLIAIDKPYGLPSHGGPGVHHSIGQLLVPLAQRIRKPELELRLVHRLDKETTGVMLLAKHLEAHHILRAMFKKRRILKKYWVLTKGVPNPTQGVIDIPMSEGTVGEKHRMTLRPRYSAENKLMLKTEVSRRTTTIEAITNYKVLDSNNSCALVECQPETGLKHQLRCHLSFALNTPILGDHKYSHFSKLAPQRLFPDILKRLGIRQSKVRHLPMHLHAVQLVLPEFRDGRNLFISARLPKHFVQNMKWLKISAP